MAASREIRRLVYGRLPLWGSIQRHGPLAPPKDQRGGGSFESRLPVPSWCTDLSLAFAALNPDGPPVRGYRFSHTGIQRLSLPQRIIYLYYDPEFAPDAPDTARADRQQWQHERERERAKAVKAHDSQRDALVAAALHIAAWKVRRLRSEAVYLMADLVRWDEEVAA